MTSSTTPQPGPVRRRNARGEGDRLREDIVATASALVDEGGEGAVALREVARRIGISAPSIYRHFPDRDAVLFAVAAAAFAELAEHVRGAAARVVEPGARLRAVCDAYLGFARERPGRYRVMFGGAWDAGPAVERGTVDLAQVQALGGEALAVFAAAVRDCADATLLTSAEPAADAVVIWVGLHGLAHQRLVAPAFPWPGGVAERLVTALTGLPPTRDRR